MKPLTFLHLQKSKFCSVRKMLVQNKQCNQLNHTHNPQVLFSKTEILLV